VEVAREERGRGREGFPSDWAGDWEGGLARRARARWARAWTRARRSLPGAPALRVGVREQK